MKRYLLVILCSVVSFASFGYTQTVMSPPMGGWKFTAHPNKSTVLSMPLRRDAAVIAEIAETSFSSDVATLTLAESIGEANRFGLDAQTGEPRYYVEFVHGAAIGERIAIIGNTTKTLFLESAPSGTIVASYSNTVSRDVVEVRPYWTLSEVFGAGQFAQVTSYTESELGASFFGEAVFLLLPGANLPFDFASKRLVSVEVEGDVAPQWRQVGIEGAVGTEELSGIPLPHGQVLMQRSVSDETREYLLLGHVSAQPMPLTLPEPEAGQIVEIPFALATSYPVTLLDSGLDAHLEAATDAASRRDELIVFADRSGSLREATVYFYMDVDATQGWRRVGDAMSDRGSFALEPATGYLIRRRR